MTNNQLNEGNNLKKQREDRTKLLSYVKNLAIDQISTIVFHKYQSTSIDINLATFPELDAVTSDFLDKVEKALKKKIERIDEVFNSL